MEAGSDDRIKKRHVYDLVAERITEEIASGALSPGDVLPVEKELTERYGVGRSSIREALRRLESQRVICPNGRGGYLVGSRGAAVGRSLEIMLLLGHANLDELTELREIIETRAARLAAERRGDDDLLALHAALRKMEEAVDSPRDQKLDADLGFHLAVANATKNSAVIAVSQGIRDVLRSALRATFWSSEEAIEQHRAIAEAIADGDGEAAEAAMKAHLSWIGTILEHERPPVV